MTKKHEILQNLKHFSGTTKYYKNFFDLLYTEGVRYLANEAKCHWLIDLIGSFQIGGRIRFEDFQVYTVKVKDDMSANVTVSDGDNNILAHQVIPYTDFPLDEITLWNVDGVLLLPSEY